MGTLTEDVMYASEQINVPLNLPYILKQYAKAAIKTQPRDLLIWSSAYFKALANGDVPPVKDRIEYPLISTPSGLTAGFLRILIKQFGKSGIVKERELINRWKGVGLETDELQSMLKLCGFRKNVRWLNFIAVAAGFLSPNLTQTMILVCELLTDEPEGGSAAILYNTFTTLYAFLARMDCGPICHLKLNMSDSTFSEDKLSIDTAEKLETVSEKSSDKLSEIEVALERKPTIDSNDSSAGVMIWEDVTHPDLMPQKSAEDNRGSEIADNIPTDFVEELITADDSEKLDADQESVKSTESYDNTGITLTFHDEEQDVKIDDYTGPIEPKLKKRFEKKMGEDGEEEEEEVVEEEAVKEETHDKAEEDQSEENKANEGNIDIEEAEENEEKTNTVESEKVEEEEKIEEKEKVMEEEKLDEEEKVVAEEKVEEEEEKEKVEEKQEVEDKEKIEENEEEMNKIEYQVEEEIGDRREEEVGEENEISDKGEEDKIVHKEEDEEAGDVAKDEEKLENKEEVELEKESGVNEENEGKKKTDASREGEKGDKKKPTMTKKKKKKVAAKKEGGEGAGEEGGMEEEESDHEEQSRYEYSLELEEEEEGEEEKGREEEESLKMKEAEEEHEEEKVIDEVKVEEEMEEEEGEEEQEEEEKSGEGESVDSAIPFQGQLKGDIEVYGKLHIPDHRNLSFTDSITSEPDNHFWAHVPGIGPIVPEKQILTLKAYFLYCSERQNGYVMPRNIKHHLCPSLEPPETDLHQSSSKDIGLIKDGK